MPAKPLPHRRFKHKESGDCYRVTEHGEAEFQGKWYEVIHCRKVNPTTNLDDPTRPLYTYLIDDFLDKFEEVRDGMGDKR